MRQSKSTSCEYAGRMLIIVLTFTFFSIFLSGAVLNAQPEPEKPTESLTLQKVLELALENSPQFFSAKSVAKARHNEYRAAQFLRLPTIHFAPYAMHSELQEKRLIPRTRLGVGRPDGLNLDQIFNDQIVALEAGLRLPLFTGGEISGKVGATRAALASAATDTVLTRDRLLFLVTINYLQLMEASEQIRFTEASRKALAKTANFIEKKVRAGKALEVDLLRINTRLAELEVGVLKARNSYKTTLLNLSALTGVSIPEEMSFADTLSFRPVVIEESRIPEIMQSSPVVQKSRWNYELARSIKKTKQAQLIPHLNLAINGGWYWGNNAVDAAAYGDNNTDLFAQIQLSVPILNFPLYRQVGAASQVVLAQEENLEQTRLNVESEIRSAFLDMEVARASISAAETAVQAAAEAFRIQESRFQAGKTTVDDLLNAEAARLNAQLNYERVLINYYRAIANVYRIRGDITVEELSTFTSPKR